MGVSYHFIGQLHKINLRCFYFLYIAPIDGRMYILVRLKYCYFISVTQMD